MKNDHNIGKEKPVKKYNWKGKKILIVEDVETNNMFFEAALQKTRVELIWAGDGLEAILALKENPDIDLILMDMRLPNMDGFEATRKIKGINANIPIISQTTYILPHERELIFEAGCDDYLPKPIRFELLINLIAKYLGPGI